MSTPQTPPSKQGTARHTGGVTHRYEGDLPGGRAVQPHVHRAEDSLQEKIKRMKREARFTEKIGQ